MKMPWCLSHRYDPAAKRLADRHYNRQRPDSPQFVPPGSCLVLLSDDAQALWVTSAPLAAYVRHAWPGAWVCSCFRNEGVERASDMISAAVAATIAFYGVVPPMGMVTFLNRKHVKPIMVRGVPTWGRTWKLAGFTEVGETKKDGLLAMQMLPEAMPAPMPARVRSMHGSPLFDGVMA